MPCRCLSALQAVPHRFGSRWPRANLSSVDKTWGGLGPGRASGQTGWVTPCPLRVGRLMSGAIQRAHGCPWRQPASPVGAAGADGAFRACPRSALQPCPRGRGRPAQPGCSESGAPPAPWRSEAVAAWGQDADPRPWTHPRRLPTPSSLPATPGSPAPADREDKSPDVRS